MITTNSVSNISTRWAPSNLEVLENRKWNRKSKMQKMFQNKIIVPKKNICCINFALFWWKYICFIDVLYDADLYDIADDSDDCSVDLPDGIDFR